LAGVSCNAGKNAWCSVRGGCLAVSTIKLAATGFSVHQQLAGRGSAWHMLLAEQLRDEGRALVEQANKTVAARWSKEQIADAKRR
jgi:hypothetical protein